MEALKSSSYGQAEQDRQTLIIFFDQPEKDALTMKKLQYALIRFCGQQ